ARPQSKRARPVLRPRLECTYNNGTVKARWQLTERLFVGTFMGMENQQTRRGRPPKDAERRKAEYLDIRLEAAEKQAFRDAAEVAGLDLSAWVRERLRAAARKELEVVGHPVAFLVKAGMPARSGGRG